MIIAATLMMVAAVASRMMNRENDRCLLKAMRRAMKLEKFK
jgi:hypothetical protein